MAGRPPPHMDQFRLSIHHITSRLPGNSVSATLRQLCIIAASAIISPTAPFPNSLNSLNSLNFAPFQTFFRFDSPDSAADLGANAEKWCKRIMKPGSPCGTSAIQDRNTEVFAACLCCGWHASSQEGRAWFTGARFVSSSSGGGTRFRVNHHTERRATRCGHPEHPRNVGKLERALCANTSADSSSSSSSG